MHAQEIQSGQDALSKSVSDYESELHELEERLAVQLTALEGKAKAGVATEEIQLLFTEVARTMTARYELSLEMLNAIEQQLTGGIHSAMVEDLGNEYQQQLVDLAVAIDELLVSSEGTL